MSINRRHLLTGFAGASLLQAEKPRAIRVDMLGTWLPCVLFGREWTTVFTFHNFGDIAGRFAVQFFGTSGQPLSVPISGVGSSTELEVSLGPGQSRTYETPYSPSDQNTTIGWGVVSNTCDFLDTCRKILCTVTIKNRASGRPDFEAIFPGQTPVLNTIIPIDNRFRHTSVLMIGAAASPTSARTATIVFTFFDHLNRRVATNFFEMPARGFRLFSLSDYPSLIDVQGRGEFSIQDGALLVTGIRINPTNSFTPLLSYEP